MFKLDRVYGQLDRFVLATFSGIEYFCSGLGDHIDHIEHFRIFQSYFGNFIARAIINSLYIFILVSILILFSWAFAWDRIRNLSGPTTVISYHMVYLGVEAEEVDWSKEGF